MELTAEQAAVVAIGRGRHLVLAPPGSGKTEMLSQRILRALEGGVLPERMLCATFTNRAAFEMRERVTAGARGRTLPDVGNLHHFCERFLRTAGVLHPPRRVIDEVEQVDLVREVLDVLRSELGAGRPADLKATHGVTVLSHLGELAPERLVKLHEDFETLRANLERQGGGLEEIALAGLRVVHQGRIGIPRELRSPWPVAANALWAMGVLKPLETAYRGIKRRFQVLDFDDLLNEAYLRLRKAPLQEEDRFLWVQVDEVQDLNPLQWAIVRELTAANAVSVYFGDLEQAIFSFLGASLPRLLEETADCVRHDFRTNFRCPPLLLEILMRFSLLALKSARTFISEPSDPSRANGEVWMTDVRDSAAVMSHVDRLLRTGMAREVALLTRTNALAEALEPMVKGLGWRYVKVSGCELGHYRPMRDFMACLDLFAGNTSRFAWTALIRRFGDGIHSRTQARYFVRAMFAAKWDPMQLLSAEDRIPQFPPVGDRARFWAWRNRGVLRAVRTALRPAVAAMKCATRAKDAFREVFEAFAETALGSRCRYGVRELLPGTRTTTWESSSVTYAQACFEARNRIEKFLRYTDHAYARDTRAFSEVLREEWRELGRFKEADLLVGDERIVISTVHKAKGRQFDAVVVPSLAEYDAREEVLRLLYVAMSRARRHLLVFDARDGNVLGDLAACFRPGYLGYYLRRTWAKDVAGPQYLEGDWLYRWETLAEQDRACRFSLEDVQDGLASPWEPVRRMAVRVTRHDVDRVRRRNSLLSLLEPTVPEVPLDVVLDTLRDVRVFDGPTVERVRVAVRRSVAPRVWSSARKYYVSSAELAGAEMQTAWRMGLEDCLYALDGETRAMAAAALDERLDTGWRDVLFGSASDFIRLGRIAAPEHERHIRAVLEIKRLPRPYETALRGVLFARATGSLQAMGVKAELNMFI